MEADPRQDSERHTARRVRYVHQRSRTGGRHRQKNHFKSADGDDGGYHRKKTLRRHQRRRGKGERRVRRLPHVRGKFGGVPPRRRGGLFRFLPHGAAQ